MNVLLPFLNSLALCLLLAGSYSLYYLQPGWNWLLFGAFFLTVLRKAIEITVASDDQEWT